MGVRRRGLLTGGAVAVAVVLVVGGLALAGGGGDDDDTIRLEPIGSSFEGDLLAGLDLRDLGGGLAIALPGVPPLGAALAGALAGRSVDGDEPGLYGGSRDAGTCDVDQLVDFLTDPANADKARAWAEVLGILARDIPTFIEGLTPVRLRFDTRVTNHGFDGAQATPLQSVLQAGTAVLVDQQGIPRVKCACGNPLLPASGSGRASDADDAWDGFDDDQLASVKARRAVESFVLVDIDDGVLFERPLGTDGEADVLLPPSPQLCQEFADSPTCTGREAAEATMPDLAGSSVAAARRALTQLGFLGAVSERREPSGDVAAGIVITTDPPAGRVIPVKSPIVLTVSSGADDEPGSTTTTSPATSTSAATSTTTSTTSSTTTSSTTTTTETRTVVVPDVIGMTQADAEARIRAAGLVPQAETVFTDTSTPRGTVVSQDPQGGAVVPAGSTVVIGVAEHVPPPG